MGLSWQQGPLSGATVGRFLTPAPLPERLLFAEPLRRRMRVRLAGDWIADSESVVLLHEPARYPVGCSATNALTRSACGARVKVLCPPNLSGSTLPVSRLRLMNRPTVLKAKLYSSATSSRV
jgi:hypothetical protein